MALPSPTIFITNITISSGISPLHFSNQTLLRPNNKPVLLKTINPAFYYPKNHKNYTIGRGILRDKPREF